VSTSLAEINVVPLVDVMLVLLIIFMVTAPLLQRGIDVKLPTAVRATAIQGERIFIDVPLAYRKDRVVYMANEPIRLDILQERIRQKMENQSEKQVYLRMDGTLQVQDQLDVMDRLRAAGVQTIGIVAERPGK
jgi:biopolymer transport protein ExbD